MEQNVTKNSYVLVTTILWHTSHEIKRDSIVPKPQNTLYHDLITGYFKNNHETVTTRHVRRVPGSQSYRIPILTLHHGRKRLHIH